MLLDQRDDVAAGEALARIVEKYALRWADDPSRPYPIDGAGSCPVGWMPLIESLVVRLIGLGWDRHLAQVKEKLGGLRFYIREGTAQMQAAIDDAEIESFKVCDHCGNPGTLRRSGRAAVRCDEHA